MECLYSGEKHCDHNDCLLEQTKKTNETLMARIEINDRALREIIKVLEEITWQKE